MISTKGSWKSHVVSRIGCRVRVDRPYGHSLAERKGTLKFRFLGDEDKLVPASLLVLVMAELVASFCFRGALREEGLIIDLISKPLAICCGNLASPISMAISKLFVLTLVLNEQRQRLHNSATAAYLLDIAE